MVENIETGEVITAYKAIQQAIKNKKKFRCFECKEELILANGPQKRAHFKHHPGSNCTYDFENTMSSWHRNFQEMFFKRGAKNEVVLLDGQRRADVFIENKGRIIELQHSNMDINACIDRTNDYLNSNYQIWWLFDLSDDYNKDYILKKYEEKYEKTFDINEVIEKCPINGCNKNIINGKFGPYCPVHKNNINNNLGSSKGTRVNAYYSMVSGELKWIKKDYTFDSKDIVTLKSRGGFRREIIGIKNNYFISNDNFKCFVYLRPDVIAEIDTFKDNKELTVINFMNESEWIDYCINR